MSIINRLAIMAVCLAWGAASARAQTSIQTNLDYWVQNLNFELTSTTNGAPVTNGIIARIKASTVRMNSKELIKALYNKPVLALSKGLATNIVVTTNGPSHAPVYTTNVFVTGQVVFTPITNASYSASARLVLETPITTNAPTLIAIRDGKPAIDFAVTNYVQMRMISFDGRTNAMVTNGKFDVPHKLVAATESYLERFVFDSNGFTNSLPVGATNSPPPPLHFEVQGLASEQRFSLIERGAVVGNDVRRGLIAAVAGTGQLANTNAFMVLQGRITANGGKHEVK
jgi:hypothetical protein